MLHYVVFWDILLLIEVGFPVRMLIALVVCMPMCPRVAMSMSMAATAPAVSATLASRIARSSESSARDFLVSIFY